MKKPEIRFENLVVWQKAFHSRDARSRAVKSYGSTELSVSTTSLAFVVDIPPDLKPILKLF
jgi:hypothetical protein